MVSNVNVADLYYHGHTVRIPIPINRVTIQKDRGWNKKI